MLTIALHIVNYNSEIDDYIEQYTGLFYKLYNKIELCEDKSFKNELLKKYNLIDVSMYDFCVKDVKTKKEQHLTEKKKKLKEVDKLEKELKCGKCSLKLRYKIRNKLSRLKKDIEKDICFGGKVNLRMITKLKQELRYNLELKTKKELSEKEIKIKKEVLDKVVQDFNKSRSMGVYMVGRACERGNRKVDFDLEHYNITFKPSKGKHFKIMFKEPSKGYKKILWQLQQMVDSNLIPLTVRILRDKICISYDNELINGYAFNEKEYKMSVNGIDDNEQKKVIAKRFIEEQNERKLKDKNVNRYFAFDSNPESIGFVILEKLSNSPSGDFKILYQEHIDFTRLNVSLKKASNDLETIRQNNKRKTELTNVWKYIFNVIKHYKVAYFVQEDLDVKVKDHDKGTVFNRKVNNIWLRSDSERLIKKNCENLGLILIEIEPMFSSVIGNLIYDTFDTIASATEIGRRGITKYIKGRSIYPSIDKINQEKLNYLLGENVSIENTTMYSICKSLSGLRVRNKEISLEGNYLYTHKSKVKQFIFPLCA